nr:helix-turn-helix domain-containing protein [uncultured Tateyamaria sp.]
MARLADELDLSRASVFRLIRLFHEGGTVASLIDRKRGRPVGHRTLDPAREEIIHAAINKHYLKRTRPSISQLARDVHADCLSAGLQPPHRRTIVARLEDVELRKRARRRGEHKIEKAATAVPGSFRPARPLDVVQITDGITANIFHMINSLAIEAVEDGSEGITDSAVDAWAPDFDIEAVYA